jgi:hypothetical protein
MGDGNGNFSAIDHTLAMRTSLDNITNTKNDLIRRPHQTTLSESDLTFTPNFVDIDGDGDSDLVLASDFNRSQILRNDGDVFTDITNKEQIDDNNGMGALLADFNNSQTMDWYVTSIYRKNEMGRTGNHLYRNDGKGGFSKDPHSTPTALEDEWSWGACTADFNNDGYMDIFYISGYGELLTTAKYENATQQKASEEFQDSYRYFANTHPRMLINDQKGGFIDESKQLGFDQPMVGRGVACFDYQQDGDIDIIINPLEGAPKLYVNQLHNNQHWLSLRLVGLPGNTEAFGTKVTLFTQSKKQYREVRFENNYLSRNPAQLHFGLGDETKIDKIEIHYPKPHEKTVILQQPTIDQLHIIYQEP